MSTRSIEDALLFPDESDQRSTEVSNIVGSVMTKSMSDSDLEKLHYRVVDEDDTLMSDIITASKTSSMLVNTTGEDGTVVASETPVQSLSRLMNTAVTVGNMHHLVFQDMQEGVHGYDIISGLIRAYLSNIESPNNALEITRILGDSYAVNQSGAEAGTMMAHSVLCTFASKEWSDPASRRLLADHMSPGASALMSLYQVEELAKSHGPGMRLSDLKSNDLSRLVFSVACAKSIINGFVVDFDILGAAMRAASHVVADIVPSSDHGNNDVVYSAINAIVYENTKRKVNSEKAYELLSEHSGRLNYLKTVVTNTYGALSNAIMRYRNGERNASDNTNVNKQDETIVRTQYLQAAMRAFASDGGADLLRASIGLQSDYESALRFFSANTPSPDGIRHSFLSACDSTQVVGRFSSYAAEEMRLPWTHTTDGSTPQLITL